LHKDSIARYPCRPITFTQHLTYLSSYIR
jgi:hypothetical protein